VSSKRNLIGISSFIDPAGDRVAAKPAASSIHLEGKNLRSRYYRKMLKLAAIYLASFIPVTPYYAVGQLKDNDKILNVRSFGARGDGVADDTAAIQAAITAAQNGATIRFPAGTYDVANIIVKNRSGLSFVGEGRNSVIKQKSGAPRIATFQGSRDIVISRLVFDANGITSYGGVMFYDSTAVRIENNSFFDSAPKLIRLADRYSVVFGKGASPSQDIQILNNTIDDLQLEVDYARKVVIEGNTVSRAVNTAGIGIFSIGDNAVAEDYLITRNKVIDPIGAGFSVGIDPPTNNNCIFRRITIANNQVIRRRTSGYGVRIGTPNSSQKTTGNIFEDIAIKDNDLRTEKNAPAPDRFIFANSSPTAGIVFNALTIRGNRLLNERSGGKGYAIDLRRIQKSLIADNRIRGAANGIYLGGDLLSNEIVNNDVEASAVAYEFEGSLGGNRITNNRFVGNPREGWKLSALQQSDLVQR
jgi:polygalacturonase